MRINKSSVYTISSLCTLFLLLAMTNVGHSQMTADKDAIHIGETLIMKSVEAHGGQAYANAHYQFVFRKKKHTVSTTCRKDISTHWTT